MFDFNGASNLAEGVDKAFVFIFSIAIFFIVGITAFMIYTVVKYNRKKKQEAKQFSGSLKLEIIWTVIPTILVLLMFYYGWVGFAPMRKVPDDAMVIDAIGRMWEWEFNYGDGKVTKDTLYVPVNRPVKLNLISEDVNHSLFIPAFRVKEDVVPGYDNFLWFTPYYIGDYELLCTEYCGLLHSSMVGKTRVLAQEEFDTWLENLVPTGDIPDPEGLVILKANSCLSCHSLDGKKLVGPSFKGYWGKEQVVVTDEGEKTIVVDEEYTINSIYNSNDEIVKGYSKNLMQSYKGTVSDEDISKIIDYLKTVN
ncbi:MAG: cytochrome c oxidase subunit II [Bacteroidales bacterium]|nr:cytochrome c oxidase subunit II [Bacteroidales bacterium]